MNNKKEIIDIKILKQLKQKYLENKVSVLVGAGFTKNVFPSSPSWWMLVHDMVSESFKREIDRKISENKHMSNPPFFLNDDQIREKCIEDIIEREGYLNVASDYERFKGDRESLDVYIEHYNPYFNDISDHESVVECLGHKIKVKESEFETHHRLLNCNWVNVFTTNFDNSLEVTNDYFHMGYDVINNGYEISTKGRKRIIKIHGNLVREDESLEEPFQFDGDKTRRYIITQDDFDTYQAKHQGFSYLLRVAMLQGAYCIVGFSGDDPNYLGWLGWVKDILDKEPEYAKNADGNITQKDVDDYKVFMIKVDDKPISLDVQLFNRNHHIGVIQLGNDDVKNFLLQDSPNPLTGTDLTKISELFKLFFSYLEPYYNKPVKEFDYTDYNKALTSVEESLDSGQELTGNAEKLVNILNDTPYVRNIFSELRILSKLIANIINKGTSRIKNKLLSALVRTTGIGYFTIDENQLKALDNIDELQDFSNREYTLLYRDSPLDNDNNAYELILRKMFQMDFNEALSLLENWNATGYDVVRKTVLLAIFFKRDLGDLEKYIEEESASQKRYIASYIYNCIGNVDNSSHRFPLGGYERRHIFGFHEVVDAIISIINDRDKKQLTSYGNNVHQVTLRDQSLDLQLTSSRLIHYLVDMGFPTCYSIFSLINVEKWYNVFSQIYRIYPVPCFYYSCFYNNARVLTRIGEDYIYTESKEEIGKLLGIAFRGLSHEGINGQFVFGILQIAKEFFCYVPECNWFDEFWTYFTNTFIPQEGKPIYGRSSLDFVSCAINHIHRLNHVNKVFYILIDYVKVNKSDALYLISNIRFDRTKPLDNVLVKAIDKLKDVVDTFEYVRILQYIPRNLLTEGILSNLADKFSKDNNKNIPNEEYGLLYYIVSLLPDNEAVINYIRSVILKSDLYSINTSKHPYGVDMPFIPLYLLSDFINFDGKELGYIKSCIDKNIKVIENSNTLKLRDTRKELTPLLQDMASFCHNFFQQEKDLIKEVDSILFLSREFFTDEEALYSNEEEKVRTAVGNLCSAVRRKDYTNLEKALSISIERGLQRKQEGLTYILFFIAYAIKNVDETFLHEHIDESKLQMMLSIYKDEDLRTYNLYFVSATQSFIDIAKYLKNNGVDNDDVKYWLSDDFTKKYDYV